MPNGIFNEYGSAVPVTTGAANTDKVLMSETLAAGVIANGNMMALRAEFDGGGTVRFTLNGVDLLNVDWPVQTGGILHVEIWRTGNTSALVRPTYCEMHGSNATQWRNGGRYPVASGLDWTAQQVIRVVGKSPNANGLSLERCGVQR